MSSGLFGLLPDELIERVLLHLSPEELLEVQLLNRRLHNIFQRSTRLQYCNALKIYGMIDGGKTIPVIDKLKELRRREKAWQSANLSRRVSISVPCNSSSIYDVSGGILMLGEYGRGAIQLASRSTVNVKFFDLESCKSGPPVREDDWRSMNVSDQIVDVAFALEEHDLVGIIGMRKRENDRTSHVILHLLQFSSGDPHPLAKLPEICVYEPHSAWGLPEISMEIVGPSLVLLLSWGTGEGHDNINDVLLLINWWTGEVLLTEEVPCLVYGGLIFLSRELFILPNCVEKALEVIKLPDLTESGNVPELHFNRIAYLSLPTMSNYCRIFGINCRAFPNPLGSPHSTLAKSGSEIGGLTSCHERPFSPDPEESLALFQFFVLVGYRDSRNAIFAEEVWDTINMFVLRRTLVNAVIAHIQVKGEVDDPGSRSEVKYVPWDVWAHGPCGDVVRWCDAPDEEWITTTSGHKYVALRTRKELIIKDFNPYAVRRARATFRKSKNLKKSGMGPVNTGRAEEDIDRVLLAKNYLDLDDRTRMCVVESYDSEEEWVDRIFPGLRHGTSTGGLPYVETIKTLENTYDAVLMDEERIICLHEHEDTVESFDVFTM